MKKAKAIIGVVVIFAIGVLCGALGDHIVGKIKFEKYVSGERNYYHDIVMRDLTRKLKLDAVQREKVNEIVKEMFLEMLIVRRQYQPQYEKLIEKQRSKIKPLLRPDQLEAYEKLIAELKTQAQKKERQEELLIRNQRGQS